MSGGGGVGWVSNFDAESKSAQLLNSLCLQVCRSKLFWADTNGPLYTMCMRDHNKKCNDTQNNKAYSSITRRILR